MERTKKWDIKALTIFVALFPFILGGFYIYTSAFAAVFLILLLLFESKSNNRIKFSSNLTFITTIVISVFFFLSCFWAIDRGVAFMGAVKFLPVPLFAIAVMQIDKTDRKDVLSKIPLSACVMTVSSFLLHLIPKLKDYFTVAGRLSGFFQYSNSFAIFLICSLVICIFYEKRIWLLLIEACILVFGVLESGSRIAFAILILAIILVLLTAENKKVKIGIGSIFAVGIIGAVIYASVTDNFYTVGRFLTISLNESTLLGRLLYYRDALPVILRHPFGLGYMGYYFTQSEFQTGVYSVMFVHNELLQIMLDIGWIPAILTAAAIIKSVFSEYTDKCDKIIIISLCVHSIFDFDFQYISLIFVLLLVADFDTGNVIKVKFKPMIFTLIFTLIIILSVWMGTSDFLDFINKDRAACKVYSFNTKAQIDCMSENMSVYNQYKISENLLKHNQHISLAYSAIANYYLSKGDIQKYIESEKKAVELSPYDNESIEKYCMTLIEIHKKYISMGDNYSADYCLSELNWVKDFLSDLKDKTSGLAWKISDKPNVKLDKGVSEYINSAVEEK